MKNSEKKGLKKFENQKLDAKQLVKVKGGEDIVIVDIITY